MSLVQVHNEWDPLEEIIVGDPLYAKIPARDYGFRVVEGRAHDTFQSIEVYKFSQKIIDETEEDIQKFISKLESLNITVRRPNPIQCEEGFKTLDWHADHFFSYCPRDIFLAIGDTIIESPNVLRSRYFESFAYKEILVDYLKSGSRWIAAPKPRLLDESYNSTDLSALAIDESEPIFDAANILRLGRDILYLVSDSGNELGLQWLQNTLGCEYKVHPCRNLYASLHIDSTLTFLRPGLILANPERVRDDNLPAFLKEWEIIYALEMVEYSYSTYNPMSSPWVGMNLLMINPNLAVVDAHQKPLIKILESKGIEIIPLVLRHGRVLAGGFHCITLDVRRKGKLESYFDKV